MRKVRSGPFFNENRRSEADKLQTIFERDVFPRKQERRRRRDGVAFSPNVLLANWMIPTNNKCLWQREREREREKDPPSEMPTVSKEKERKRKKGENVQMRSQIYIWSHFIAAPVSLKDEKLFCKTRIRGKISSNNLARICAKVACGIHRWTRGVQQATGEYIVRVGQPISSGDSSICLFRISNDWPWHSCIYFWEPGKGKFSRTSYIPISWTLLTCYSSKSFSPNSWKVLYSSKEDMSI